MDGHLKKESFRYLGYAGHVPDPSVIKLVEEVYAELAACVQPASLTRTVMVGHPQEGILEIEGCRIESRSLSRNLAGCKEVCLMAATLGMAPDRLIARSGAQGLMSRAVVIQAVSAAMIEEYCDEVNERICREASARSLFCRPRFSPGYGDFPVHFQEDLFRILQIQKRIGITLTENNLMIPSKSVTALIGLSAEAAAKGRHRCEDCSHKGCSFRSQRDAERDYGI